MHIADTKEQAIADVAFGLEEWVDYFQRVAALPLAPDTANHESLVDALNASGFAVIGTVEDAIDQIERLRAQSGGFGTFLLMGHEWADTAATRHSYELFARYVAPAVPGHGADADRQPGLGGREPPRVHRRGRQRRHVGHPEAPGRESGQGHPCLSPMPEITHEQIPTNGIELHVATAGPADGPPVVLCHGFPELWYSWRHQLGALGDGRLPRPGPRPARLRRAAAPKRSAAYGSDQLTADLCGLLDHYGYDQAAFVGHDWGAMVVWEMGRLHPERVSSLFNMSVPFSQSPGPADRDLRGHLRGQVLLHPLLPAGRPGRGRARGRPPHFLRTMLYAAGGEAMANGRPWLVRRPAEGTRFLDTLSPAPAQLPPWMTEDDVDVYAAAFEKSGFFGPLSFYRNMDANWERSKDIPAVGATPCPSGSSPARSTRSTPCCRARPRPWPRPSPTSGARTAVDGAGHWVQQERPDETNAALLAFLAEVG